MFGSETKKKDSPTPFIKCSAWVTKAGNCAPTTNDILFWQCNLISTSERILHHKTYRLAWQNVAPNLIIVAATTSLIHTHTHTHTHTRARAHACNFLWNRSLRIINNIKLHFSPLNNWQFIDFLIYFFHCHMFVQVGCCKGNHSQRIN